jgi:predicted SnoaL-like aldol condensation-catalyzing enzyme
MKMSNNHDAAIAFLELSASGQVREAFEKFVGNGFRHHNPYFAGSAESLMMAMDENARQSPDKALEIKRVISEGEFVVVHSHVRQKPGDLGAAVAHIFRFEEGRIVELWDVGQLLPNESSNPYGMF